MRGDLEKLEARILGDLSRIELKFVVDIEKVEARLMGEIGNLRKDFDVRFAQMDGKLVLLQWMLGLLLAGVAGLVAKSFF